MTEQKTITLTDKEQAIVNNFAEGLVKNRNSEGINYLCVPVCSKADFNKDNKLMAQLARLPEPLYKTWQREAIKNVILGAALAGFVFGGSRLISRFIKEKRKESE